MDNIKSFKEKVINNYISNIDYNTIDIERIKEDLQQLIGEKPAIKLNYKQESLLNEDGSKGKKFEKLESITVIFTYDTTIGDRTVPVPVTETFIIG